MIVDQMFRDTATETLLFEGDGGDVRETRDAAADGGAHSYTDRR